MTKSKSLHFQFSKSKICNNLWKSQLIFEINIVIDFGKRNLINVLNFKKKLKQRKPQ